MHPLLLARVMMFAYALPPLLCGVQLPAPMAPSRASAVPVLTGGDTSNLLFGKIQRHATLPGSRLSPNPLAAVDDQGRLGKALWSQFMMSSVPQQDKASRSDLDRSPRVVESLLFIDCTKAAAGGGGGLPNPFGMFGDKVVAQAGRLPDAALLSLAAGRGAMHVYVMVDGTGEGGGTAALAECVASLQGLGLCATLIAPEDGVALESTPGWSCGQLQDHEGELQTPLAVRNGLQPAGEAARAAEAAGEATEAAQLVPSPAAAAEYVGSTLPREDFAELVLQYVPRYPHPDH
jgi:hypothetical protein